MRARAAWKEDVARQHGQPTVPPDALAQAATGGTPVAGALHLCSLVPAMPAMCSSCTIKEERVLQGQGGAGTDQPPLVRVSLQGACWVCTFGMGRAPQAS